ncbi:MAG: DUF5333 domain-containing protein [Pseudomonadota bacterium]
MIRLLLTVILVLAPLGATLSARSPGDVSEVRNGLLAVAVGNLIQENCATISPRLIRVYSLRNQLLAAARSEGFTDAEIDAYVDDKAARARLEVEAAAYLRQNGVVDGANDTYCTVGRAEIAANSAVGRLLRER